MSEKKREPGFIECPFCAGAAEYGESAGGWRVFCRVRQCRTSKGPFGSREEAAAAWNRRGFDMERVQKETLFDGRKSQTQTIFAQWKNVLKAEDAETATEVLEKLIELATGDMPDGAKIELSRVLQVEWSGKELREALAKRMLIQRKGAQE